MCASLLDAEAVIAGAPAGMISRSQILSTDFNVEGLEMERLHAQKTGMETLHLERVNKLLLRDSAPLPD